MTNVATLNALEAPGLRELDEHEAKATTGGDIEAAVVALGIAVAGAFTAGFKLGFDVIGPWMFG